MYSQDSTLQDLQRAYMLDTVISAARKANSVQIPKNFSSAQQALLEVRVAVEAIYTTAKSDKIYGRSDLADKFDNAIAVILAMSALLKAKDDYDVRAIIADGKPVTVSEDKHVDISVERPVKKRTRKVCVTQPTI